jgi:hypothetical protein
LGVALNLIARHRNSIFIDSVAGGLEHQGYRKLFSRVSIEQLLIIDQLNIAHEGFENEQIR